MLPTKAKIARRSFDDSQDFLKNFQAVDFQPDTGRRALVLFLSIAGSTEAQVTASVNGTVRDTTGAVIAGADVLLHSNDTTLNRITTTNDAGYYYIADVKPGNYELKVTKQGFRSAIQTGINLVVNQSASLQPDLVSRLNHGERHGASFCSRPGDLHRGAGRRRRKATGE